jgi:hypothetical protein
MTTVMHDVTGETFLPVSLTPVKLFKTVKVSPAKNYSPVSMALK